MDRRKEIDTLMASMSEEEMRARAEAYTLGQLNIMQAAIQALIAVSPKPDYIQLRLAQTMAEMQKATPDYPGMDWVPEAVAKGATPVAEAFLQACQANMDVIRKQKDPARR